MKKINFKKFFLEFSKNKLTLLMSVLFSVVLWISTIMFSRDSYTVIKISDVPVISNLSNTQAEQLGLSVVKITPSTVSVYVRGPRHKVSFIKKDDIIVTPKTYSSVLYSGSYNLELQAFFNKPQNDVTIESISHKNVVFVVDVLETKLVKLVPDELNISVQEGFIKDETVCQPNSLFVSGPKQSIDKLASIKLLVKKEEVNKNLNSTKIFDATPQFISVDGNVMDSSVFKYSEEVNFNIKVPIYKVKKIPLKILYKNVPESLNLNLLKPKITPYEIEVGGPLENIENIQEISLGYLDLRDLSESKTDFSFKINIPSGFKNLGQISTATVSFDDAKFSYKHFNVSGVELLNVPKDCDLSINSKTIKDVKIVGFKEFLKNVNSTNLTATVDCSNINFKNGMQNVPVEIGVINKDGVWPVGEYKCSINCKKKWNHNNVVSF